MKLVLEIDFFMSNSTDVSLLTLEKKKKKKTTLPLQFQGIQKVHKMRRSLGSVILR